MASTTLRKQELESSLKADPHPAATSTTSSLSPLGAVPLIPEPVSLVRLPLGRNGEDDASTGEVSPSGDPVNISVFRVVHSWRKRRAGRIYKKLITDNEGSGQDSTDGPMSRLWNCYRLRSTMRPKTKVFTDSWILREFLVGYNDLLPSSPLKNVVKHKSADPSPIWCIEISGDGRYLAVGLQSGLIYIYESNSLHSQGLFDERPFGVYVKHTAAVVSIKFLQPLEGEDKTYLISVGMDKILSIWQLDEPRPIECIRTSEWASSVSMHPSQERIVFLGVLDATVQVWNLNTDKTKRSTMLDYIRVPDVVTALAVSPDCLWLAVGVRSGRVALYEMARMRFISEIECRNRRKWKSPAKVIGIDWGFDSSCYLATTHDHSFRKVELEIHLKGGEEQQLFTGHSVQHLLLSAAFMRSPGNDSIITGSEDSCVYIWPKSDDTCNFDKVKVSTDLITAFHVPPHSFLKFIHKSVRDALSVELGGKKCRLQEESTYIPNTCREETYSNIDMYPDIDSQQNFIVGIVGTYSGEIKIFMNWDWQAGTCENSRYSEEVLNV